ncbi:hypothetical protein, conserved [Trypanosoma brucei gambiense DAL972]|uniref:T. brucei spp.-specific protein n=1 Tax=Trypanosoma brucei gambiense (strain MHOM/CI/86/DAL972) TaxID=679716 RepID=C9ZTN6_TRYB9|nr:hypothetical protein, conserved [Trypanosoma brucei gambiense DAL972]CBH12771.1 hypothetical protein, conserved [Trypanosoma brucei gambiense DAL972]|eukprot:XP_011775051.1 hypothetical protein, conserved [Trypanosoma brucei gambiense DAL972]
MFTSTAAYCGSAGSRLFVVALLLAFCVVTGTTVADERETVNSSCENPSLHDTHHWGFLGGGYHMQLEVEFPLIFNSVDISLDLPRTFFFDAAELEQLYSIKLQGSKEDITWAYQPLRISSDYFFDIEAPVFHVGYEVNRVNITFERLPSASRRYSNGSAAAIDIFASADDARGRLLVPIHARYEEVDSTTPFSLQAFFSRNTSVRRCIPSITVRGVVVDRGGRCVKFVSALMKRYDDALTSSLTSPPVSVLDGNIPEPSPGCRNVPVGLLSSLRVVYTTVVALQCIGAAIVILSLLLL